MGKEVKFVKPSEEVAEEPEQVQQPVKKVSEFVLVQVPTQHTIAVQTPEGDVVSSEELLVLIANKLNKIEKSVSG